MKKSIRNLSTVTTIGLDIHGSEVRLEHFQNFSNHEGFQYYGPIPRYRDDGKFHRWGTIGYGARL
jgi:hypothetical protein